MGLPTLLHVTHQALLHCAEFLVSVHAPMWDVMHWDNFQSPDSKPQMCIFDLLQTHDNTITNRKQTWKQL